ncbi:MAG: 2-oxo acid dehydrogenase subunit E2 [Verrucomicrobiae bacterium]|nr:2-oxo acid dehydrogenase subunit E2 [Verrucomicrobiae bacterium]
MAQPITMPKFGQMTEESAIVEWRKKEGDKVLKGDILFTVETDKSVMEVEAFTEGTLLKIVVPAGVTVPVQTVVGYIGQPGEPIPATAPLPATPAPAAAAPAVAMKTAPAASVPRAPEASVLPSALPPMLAPIPPAVIPAAQVSAAPSVFRISPRAAALARHCVIDPTKIAGTGPGGRVVERDVRAYLEARGYHKLRITPAAKNLAAKEGVDLLTVVPGDGLRVTVADVERAIAERPKPMTRMRQTIAQRLTQSKLTQPHFYVTVSVDMTDLIAYRNRLKAAGAPYTITDFIAQAVVLCLQEFPTVNSSTDGKSVRWHSHVNLGLAVSIEGGLVVPVIHRAEQLTMREICERSKELVEKARAGKLTPDEMSGGTFTISNMGMLDVENFAAIINPGEGAILAVASTIKQPVVRDDKIVVRQMMKMTLSVDHRLIDGALAAQFVNAIKAKLEDLELWERLA